MSKHEQPFRNGRGRRSKKQLELGGYLIVTDTQETESNYFHGIRNRIPSNCRDRLQIKIYSQCNTQNMINFAQEERNKDPRFRSIWLIFDRDEMDMFDKLIQQAHSADIHVGWSNPCFEIWLSAYFGCMEEAQDSIQCCKNFEKILIKNTNKTQYHKSDVDLYDVLQSNGDEDKAIKVAELRYRKKCRDCEKKQCSCEHSQSLFPSEMTACTTVYQLIQEINSKI